MSRDLSDVPLLLNVFVFCELRYGYWAIEMMFLHFLFLSIPRRAGHKETFFFFIFYLSTSFFSVVSHYNVKIS